MVQAEIQEAGKAGAQLIELRLDFLSHAPDFKRLLTRKPCDMVATLRRPQDGGRWKGTEDERKLLMRQCIVGGFEWVDIETDIAAEIPRFGDTRRIVSYHSVREMPEKLEQIHAEMCKQDADIVKIVVRAQRPMDNLRVLKLMHNAPKPTIAFCLGELGFPSRILSGRLGAPWTYAAFNKERGIAPGLPSFEEVRRIYRYDKLDSKTAVYGLIGDPVAHSLSPLVHNLLFQRHGVNGVYVPFRVARGDLEEFVKAFESLPVRGYSVTIPHKEAAAHTAPQKDPLALRIGAANTLVRLDSAPQHQGIVAREALEVLADAGQQRGFIAYNTDAQAAVDSLLANLPVVPDAPPPTIATRTVLILGAGGAARAVAHAMQREGAAVTVTNRTNERALQLAQELGCRALAWDARHSVTCDTLVNCTSVGMEPEVDEIPVHTSFLKPGLVVFDCVYTPENTLLINAARKRNCHVITGVEMFVRQAALQFRLFTGVEPSLEYLRDLVRKSLSHVRPREVPE
jgi:3-dehydroquinate dehydratase/shikimate dehydrogenase